MESSGARFGGPRTQRFAGRSQAHLRFSGPWSPGRERGLAAVTAQADGLRAPPGVPYVLSRPTCEQLLILLCTESLSAWLVLPLAALGRASSCSGLGGV